MAGIRHRAFAIFLLCVGSLVHAAPASGAAAPQFGHLVLVAPAAQGSGWDDLARAMARILVQTKLARSVEVEDIPGERGKLGLERFTMEHRGDGEILLVGGRTLQQSSPTALLLGKTVPVARLTGEFEVLVFPAGSDVESMDSIVRALNAKPRKLPRVPLNSLKEQGTDFSMANWRGVFAAPGVNQQQAADLTQLIGRMVDKLEWKAELERFHWTDIYLPQAEFATFIKSTREDIGSGGRLASAAPAHNPVRWRMQVWVLRNREWLGGTLLLGLLGSGALFLVQRNRAGRRERTLTQQLEIAREIVDRSAAEHAELLRGLSEQIDRQMLRWGLTEAEQEVALLILKGLRHREIAEVRGTSERTVRQQAITVYKKAGIGGRTDLAAFFLEDMLQPSGPFGTHR